ncbi:MAG: FAD-dependent oxidoreductase [Thermoanaerobaculia bacterium]|nr:FAD-dependent oxidoreductase [Thermoanaerobaculia bacterium]
MNRFDVAILGGGFAGSILARCLAAEGARVLLVEKALHPRFALGESTTPLANFALERLAGRYGFSDLHSLAAWGRWQQALPELRHGRKRGFSFYGHQVGEPFHSGSRNERRALFAASPNDFVADTHWLRADVDHHLILAAAEAGVDIRQGAEVVDLEIGRGIDLAWVENGSRHKAAAGRVVDATGAASLVSRRLGLDGADPLPFRTSLVAAHVQGLADFLPEPPPAPYPEEQAAVHHLLDGGWLYVLPFDGPSTHQAVVSIGLVMRSERMKAHGSADAESTLRSFLSRFPTLDAQFRDALPVSPWQVRENLAYRRTASSADRWLLLPGAYCFLDPLFSTGIAWSLLGVERARDVLCGHASPARYSRQLSQEADQMTRLIESAWRALGSTSSPAERFDDFVAVGLCYFGAVSWAESLGRLGDGPDEMGSATSWHGFLGAGDAVLERAYEDLSRRLRDSEPRRAGELRRSVVEQLRSRDVAGLDQPAVPNVFPLDLELLVRRAHRMGLEPDVVRARLDRLRGQLGGSAADPSSESSGSDT